MQIGLHGDISLDFGPFEAPGVITGRHFRSGRGFV